MLLTFSGRELSWEACLDHTTTVAIIGAGPAGLAVAACLRQAGVDFIIIEKDQQAAVLTLPEPGGQSGEVRLMPVNAVKIPVATQR